MAEPLHVRPATEALCRACELADEVRWRFDLDAVAFRESLATSKGAAWLDGLWVLGAARESWLLYATADVWVNGALVPARVDAGGLTLEADQLDALLRAARGRRTYGEPLHDVVVLLAADLLRR